MAETIFYSDFDVNLQRNAVTHDIIKRVNEKDIRQSIIMLLATTYYSRKWRPKFGSYFPVTMFKPNTVEMRIRIHDEIETLLKTYEPRIEVKDIVVQSTGSDEDRGIVKIDLSYYIYTLKVEDSFSYIIKRTN